MKTLSNNREFSPHPYTVVNKTKILSFSIHLRNFRIDYKKAAMAFQQQPRQHENMGRAADF